MASGSPDVWRPRLPPGPGGCGGSRIPPIPGRWLRLACLVTALANCGGTLGLLLFQRPLFERLGIPVPLDPHYFVWMAGLSFANGLLAYYVYRDPQRSRDLLKVGIVGKGFFSLAAVYYYIFAGLHGFFLLMGLWDGVFAFIFALYLIQIQAPDLARMNDGEVWEGNGSVPRRAAILFYSLTGTGRQSVHCLKRGLESGGYTVDSFPIRPIERDLFSFPFRSLGQFLRIAGRAILRRPARIEPLRLPAEHDYDLVVVEAQTWFVGVSAPVEAVFQDEGNRAFFEGRDAAVVVVCRGLWRRSQAMVVRHLERFGARVVGSRAYEHTGREPSRLFTLAAYLATGGAGRPRWLRWILQPRCGLGGDELADVERFGAALAARRS